MDIIMTLLMAGLSTWILKKYFDVFLGSGKDGWLCKMHWGFFSVWQIVSILDIVKYPFFMILSISVMAVLMVSFNYEGHIFKKIVFTVVYNSLWMLMEVLVAYMFIFINAKYITHDILGSLLSKALMFLLVKALGWFFGNEKIKDLPNSYSMILVLIPLGSMFVMYTLFWASVDNQRPIHIIMPFAALIIMLLINILIFTTYLKLSEDLELRQKNVVYRQEIQLYNKYIEEKENSMLEFRSAKHNLKNQFIFLLERCEKREYNELEQFLKQLIKKAFFEGLTISNTQNSVVDALVNYKYTVAKRFGIQYMVKLDIPMHLPYDNGDMCIILGNTLDNALEANIRSKIENRYIKLKMRMDSNNLLIVVENSFDGIINRDKKGQILTVKTNKIDHGMGLTSIKKAVEKYHGIMKISYTNSVFITEILLYDEQK